MADTVHAATLFGGRAHLVRVETLLGRGLTQTVIVGMPDAVAREARERLPPALAAHGCDFHRGRILFNLAPAELPKRGLPLDLALAVGILAASGQVPEPAVPRLYLAELDLGGRLARPARGTLLAALAAAGGGVAELVAHPDAAREAALAPGVRAYGLRDLGELHAFLHRPEEHAPVRPRCARAPAAGREPRLDDVRGHEHARWAAVLAAAGRHHLWLQGPPGTGKSLLARRLPVLLPDLDASTALALAQVEALHGPVDAMATRPPLRAPHTSASPQALLGGGRPLLPGELSRAHGGVLFLDELPEFARPVLEGLRQPLEEKEVRLQRAREWASFPADCQLVATSNPCACGFATHPRTPCRCTPHRLQSYRNRASGPLRDRFDLFVEMGPPRAEELDGPPTPPRDEEAARLLAGTRRWQRVQARSRGFQRAADAGLDALQAAGVEPRARATLRHAAEELALSGRGVLRCLRVARTCADLAQSARVRHEDVLRALSYRLPPEEEAATTATRRSPRPAAPRRSARTARGSARGRPG